MPSPSPHQDAGRRWRLGFTLLVGDSGRKKREKTHTPLPGHHFSGKMSNEARQVSATSDALIADIRRAANRLAATRELHGGPGVIFTEQPVK